MSTVRWSTAIFLISLGILGAAGVEAQEGGTTPPPSEEPVCCYCQAVKDETTGEMPTSCITKKGEIKNVDITIKKGEDRYEACARACTTEGNPSSRLCFGLTTLTTCSGKKAEEVAAEKPAQEEPFKIPGSGGEGFPEIFGRAIRVMLGISGSLAFAVIIYGGFLYLTSGGSPETITKAKTMIIWAALGLVAIFASYALVSFVFQTISQAVGVPLKVPQ